MNIGQITIGQVERMSPQEADKSLADSCLMLAQLIIELNRELEELKSKVAQLERPVC